MGEYSTNENCLHYIVHYAELCIKTKKNRNNSEKGRNDSRKEIKTNGDANKSHYIRKVQFCRCKKKGADWLIF